VEMQGSVLNFEQSYLSIIQCIDHHQRPQRSG